MTITRDQLIVGETYWAPTQDSGRHLLVVNRIDHNDWVSVRNEPDKGVDYLWSLQSCLHFFVPYTEELAAKLVAEALLDPPSAGFMSAATKKKLDGL